MTAEFSPTHTELAVIDADGYLTWRFSGAWSVDGFAVASMRLSVTCPFEQLSALAGLHPLPVKPREALVSGIRCSLYFGDQQAVTGPRLAVLGAMMRCESGDMPEVIPLNDEQARRLIAGDVSAADEAVEEHYRDRPLRPELVAAPAPRYGEAKA